MKKILIIDGNFLAYSKIPNSKDAFLNEPNNILVMKNFMKKILKYKYVVFRNYEIIVVFDERNKETFRHKLYKKYKQKPISEKKMKQKEYIYDQIELIKMKLKQINIPFYSSPHWEADDIIGMLTSKLEERNYLTTIISGDKDILQLISKKTRVYFSKSDSSNSKNKSIIIDRKNIWKITDGVWPDQVIQMKMLVGDFSDNIKGIGIIKDGKINYWNSNEASDLIKKWNSIDNILKNIEKIPDPYKESLKRGIKKLELNRTLVTIVREWKIEPNFEFFINNEIYKEEIKNIISDLSLNSIWKNKKFILNYENS